MGLFHDIYNLTLVFSGVDWIFGVPYSYGPKYQIITGETTGYFYGIIRNVGCLIIPPYFLGGGGQHSNSKFLEPNSKLFLEFAWILYHALWTRSEHEFFGNTKSKLG